MRTVGLTSLSNGINSRGAYPNKAFIYSTIAALSSCVPTLSFAYSVKALGINQDTYGHTDFVIDLEDLSASLTFAKIKELITYGDAIRAQLAERMTTARSQTLVAGGYLRQVVETGRLR